jgi:hypothetical protein
MSVRRWPDPLPGPSIPQYGLRPIDPTVRTAMEVGAQRTRRRTLARMDRVKVQWRMSPQQYAVFRKWYEGLTVSLLGASDDLAIWSLSQNVTRSAGVAISPELLAVDRILETTATGVHRVERARSEFAVNNADLLARATVKAAGRTLGRLWIHRRDGFEAYTEFDLTAGTLAGQNYLLSRSIEDRGNGWWRVTIAANLSSGVDTPSVRIALRDASGALSYTGDAAKGFDICEVQARFPTGYDLFVPSDANGKGLGADGGAAWFYTLVPTEEGLVMAEAKFVGPFDEAIEPGMNRIITAELEVRYA